MIVFMIHVIRHLE